jgi:pyruvate,water dikinase
MIDEVIDEAHRAGKPVGICGQAPSDFPDFAEWLVEQGITSISLNPDVAIKTQLVIARAEAGSTLPIVIHAPGTTVSHSGVTV